MIVSAETTAKAREMQHQRRAYSQGDNRTDMTRLTFNPIKHLLRVLIQQGRVHLDADLNEQTDIILHRLHTLTQDLVGPYAAAGDGFKITLHEDPTDEQDSAHVWIQPGHFYLDGLLLENNRILDEGGLSKAVAYDQQPYYLLPEDKGFEKNAYYLLYLEAWERSISYIEDQNFSCVLGDQQAIFPSIREVGLGGADTAARSHVVWQVKAVRTADAPGRPATPPANRDKALKVLLEAAANLKAAGKEAEFWNMLPPEDIRPGTGLLRAIANVASAEVKTPCNIPPQSRYRGPENQLYRVEIFRKRTTPVKPSLTKRDRAEAARIARDGETPNSTDTFFVWSRDNSAVTFPILSVARTTEQPIVVTLEHLGRDTFQLAKGHWVEMVDDDTVLQHHRRYLAQVIQVDPAEKQVFLNFKDLDSAGNLVPLEDKLIPDVGLDLMKRPLLRRWDSDGLLSVNKMDLTGLADLYDDFNQSDWTELEAGIFVQFLGGALHDYQEGDFWLIPARTETGDIEWTQMKNSAGQVAPVPMPPNGVLHHFAPLALISVNDLGNVTIADCRRKLKPMWE